MERRREVERTVRFRSRGRSARYGRLGSEGVPSGRADPLGGRVGTRAETCSGFEAGRKVCSGAECERDAIGFWAVDPKLRVVDWGFNTRVEVNRTRASGHTERRVFGGVEPHSGPGKFGDKESAVGIEGETSTRVRGLDGCRNPFPEECVSRNGGTVNNRGWCVGVGWVVACWVGVGFGGAVGVALSGEFFTGSWCEEHDDGVGAVSDGGPAVRWQCGGSAVVPIKAMAVCADTTQTGLPMTGERRMIVASCPMITGDPLIVVR